MKQGIIIEGHLAEATQRLVERLFQTAINYFNKHASFAVEIIEL